VQRRLPGSLKAFYLAKVQVLASSEIPAEVLGDAVEEAPRDVRGRLGHLNAPPALLRESAQRRNLT
jgi:hypothetical protein